jgi:hypothetical protein
MEKYRYYPLTSEYQIQYLSWVQFHWLHTILFISVVSVTERIVVLQRTPQT